MKVKLEDGYRRIYTLEKLDEAKRLIAAMKEYDDKPEHLACQAIKLAFKGCTIIEILKCDAVTGFNSRLEYDRMDTGTGQMDVWITAWANIITIDDIEYKSRVVRVGAFLSDIWDEGDRNEMYIREFVEK